MINTDTIAEYVRSVQNQKRYTHTLAVAADTKVLCEIFDLDKDTSQRMYCAALLHDVTKQMPPEVHKEICERNGYTPPHGGYTSPTIHAVSGAYFAREKYPDIIDERMWSAIRYHTTGKANMTICELILAFADFTEPNRPYDICKTLRQEFYDGVKIGTEPLRLLQQCSLKSFDATITSLINNGDYIDSDTFIARDYLLNCLKGQ